MAETESIDEEPQLIPLPKLGTTLGSYKLLKLLGVGGMGRIYVAEHHTLGRKVALKLLLPEYAQNPEIVQRFFNEARAVNQINHPNIVQIVDFVEDPHGFNYFIMELLDGRDLRKTREAEGPFLLGRTVSVGKQMASALAAAHGQGIVHRDIKPDNVVLLPHEERPNFIKLLDFGIAKLSSGVSEEQKTRLGMVLGTPGYMSPEQAFGRPIDGRSDIYALGVLLHWMLVDKLPSAGNLPMRSTASKIEGEPPPDPLSVTARGQPIPPALKQLVERCLRFDPDDRIQSMERVRDELAALAPTDIDDSSATPAPTMVDLPAVAPTASGETKLLGAAGPTQPPSPERPLLAGPSEAQTRLGPTPAGPTPSPAQPSPPAQGAGTFWIGAAAAAAVIGLGLYWVLRPLAPEAPPAPVGVAAAPAPAPPAPSIAAAPSPSTQVSPPPTPAAPVPPPPLQAAAPQADKPATSPAPVAASPKPKPVRREKTVAKAPTTQTDDTTILDPLTGEPLK